MDEMEAYLDLEIREHLARYMTGHRTLREFQDWFAPVAMEVEASGNPGAITLAHLIDLRLAEYTDGFWTELELRQCLAPHAFLQVVSDPSVARTWTASAAKPVRRRLEAALH